MPRDAITDDKTALKDAAQMQKLSLESLERSRINATQTHDMGVQTLDELYAQRRTLERISHENERVSNELGRTERLQNKLSRWALDFGGNRAAKKHVAADQQNAAELQKYRENTSKDLKKSTEEEEVEEKSGPVKGSLTKSRKKTFGRKKKSVSPPRQRGLIDGVDKKHKHRKELEELNEVDKEVDAGLDALGSQLDALTELSKTIGEETKSQRTKVNDAVKEVENNTERQAVAAKRLGRFFTGGRRQQRNEATQAKMLGPLAKSAVGL